MATSATSNSSSQPFRLFDLPPELRNRIYAFAIPHSSSNGEGIIAPSLFARTSRSWALIQGEWRKTWLFTCQPSDDRDSLVSSLDLTPVMLVRMFANHEKIKFMNGKEPWSLLTDGNQRYVYGSTTKSTSGRRKPKLNVCNGHVCTMQCLTLPSLSKVSKQLRKETSGLFRENNSLYLNLSNFFNDISVYDISHPLLKDSIALITWWRRLGKTTLSTIPDVQLFDCGGLQFQLTGTSKIIGVHLTHRMHYNDGEWSMRKRDAGDSDWVELGFEGWGKTVLFRLVKGAQEQGLCVAVLEELVAA